LLGCPTTTRKPGLKDYGLSKARNTDLHSGIKTSRYEAMLWNGAQDRTWGFFNRNCESLGLTVTCNICVRKNRINIERVGAKSDLVQQAQKMVSLSNSRLPAVGIETNVVGRVPDLD